MADEPATPDPEQDPAPQDPPAADTDPAPEPEPTLPPEVKAILDKERKAARAADAKSKKDAAALAKALKELDTFREAQLSEQEKAVKAARDEGFTEGRTLGDKRLIRAEVISAAAGKAADPNDVYALLEAGGVLKDIEVTDDGAVDTKTITSLVDALLEEKKHLAAAPPARDPDFGARPAVTPAPNSDAAMDNWLRQASRR